MALTTEHDHEHDVCCCPHRHEPDPQYAVVCTVHGQQALTEEEYLRGLAQPNELWLCPLCKRVAEWDNRSLETCGV